MRTFRDRSDAPLTDPAVIALVADLRKRSPDFRQVWDSRELRRVDTDTLQARHPAGLLTFTMITFQDLSPTGVRITAYLPADSVTAHRLQTTQEERPQPS